MPEGVRGIRESEYDACLDLLDRAFENTPRGYFEKYFYADPWFKPDYTRLYADSDNLLSCVQIVKRVVRVGRTRLVMGGIANVGTLPEYRGRGYSTQCLKSSIEIMGQDGFDLSILYTGINPFYEKLGWVTVPVNFVSGKLNERLPEPSGRQYQIRDYADEFDAQAVVDIYNLFNEDIVLSAERTVDYWRGFCLPHPNRIRIIETSDGATVGYGIYAHQRGMLVLSELAYLPGHEDCLDLLFADFTHTAKAVNENAALFLPEMDEINKQKDAVFAGYETGELRSGMFRIIGLQQLFEKMLGELGERVYRPDATGSLAIITEVGSVGLRVKPGKVEIIEPASCQSILKTDQMNLCRFLFGLAQPEDPGLAKILFPKRPSMFWLTDHF